MGEIENGGSAFPIICDDPNVPYEAGMSLRDYFAAQAMNGMLSNNRGINGGWAGLALDAYQVADEMLKARKQ